MNSFTYWTGRMCAVAGLPICANPFVTAADRTVWADGHADWHSERLGLRVPKLEPEVMERAG